MASLFVRSLLPWVLEPLQRLSRRAGAPRACSTALLGAPRTCSTALLGTPRTCSTALLGTLGACSTILPGTPAGAPRAYSTALLGTPAGAPRACSTALLGTGEARPFLSGRSPPLLQPALGLKTKRVLRKRCKDCYLVKRRGRWFVYCKTHPRHKQRQM